jgi:hypothetical protein
LEELLLLEPLKILLRKFPVLLFEFELLRLSFVENTRTG